MTFGREVSEALYLIRDKKLTEQQKRKILKDHRYRDSAYDVIIKYENWNPYPKNPGRP